MRALPSPSRRTKGEASLASRRDSDFKTLEKINMTSSTSEQTGTGLLTVAFRTDPAHNATVEAIAPRHHAESLFSALCGRLEEGTSDFRAAFVQFLEEMAAPRALLWSGVHKLSRPDAVTSPQLLPAMSVYLGRPINLWLATASSEPGADLSEPADIQCVTQSAGCPHGCCPAMSYVFGQKILGHASEPGDATYYRRSYNLVAFKGCKGWSFSRVLVPDREVQSPAAVRSAHRELWKFLSDRRDLKTLRLYRGALLLQKKNDRVDVCKQLLSIVAAGAWRNEADRQGPSWEMFTHIRSWWQRNKPNINPWRDHLRLAELSDAQRHRCEWLLVALYLLKNPATPSSFEKRLCKFKEFKPIPLSNEETASWRYDESALRDRAKAVLRAGRTRSERALVGVEPSNGTWSEMGGRRFPQEGTEDSARRILFAHPRATSSMTDFREVKAEHPNVPLSERTSAMLAGFKQKNAEATRRAREIERNYVVAEDAEDAETSSEPGFYFLSEMAAAAKPPRFRPRRLTLPGKGPPATSGDVAAPQGAPSPAAPDAPAAPAAPATAVDAHPPAPGRASSPSPAADMNPPEPGHGRTSSSPSSAANEGTSTHSYLGMPLLKPEHRRTASLASESPAVHSASAAFATLMCKDLASAIPGEPKLQDLLVRFSDLEPQQRADLRAKLARLRDRDLHWEPPSHLTKPKAGGTRTRWHEYVGMPTLVEQPVFKGFPEDVKDLEQKHIELRSVVELQDGKKPRLLGRLNGLKSLFSDTAVWIFFDVLAALCEPSSVLVLPPVNREFLEENFRAKLGIGRRNKFQLMTDAPRLILAPINVEGIHYVLMAVHYDGRNTACIGVFDSLNVQYHKNGPVGVVCEKVQILLHEIYEKQKKNAQSNPLVIRAMASGPGPQQNEYDKSNGTDCGLFTCLNGLSLVRGQLPQYRLGSEDAISRLRLEFNRFLLHLPSKVEGTETYESVASILHPESDDVEIALTSLRNMLNIV